MQHENVMAITRRCLCSIAHTDTISRPPIRSTLANSFSAATLLSVVAK